MISILLNFAFRQTASYSQSLVKILWKSDRDKFTFEAIEKHRHGLRETVSKHLKVADCSSQHVVIRGLSLHQGNRESFFSRYPVATNGIAPAPGLDKPHSTHNPLICADEGLVFETVALSPPSLSPTVEVKRHHTEGDKCLCPLRVLSNIILA